MAEEQEQKKKRGWKFWGAIIVVCLLIGSCMSGKKDDSQKNTSSSQPVATTEQKAPASEAKPEKQVAYTEVTIDQLISDVKSNAAKAQKKYKDKDLKIVGGHVGTIDSDADYIGLDSDQDFTMVNIQCFAKGKNSKALKDQIVELDKNQRLIVYGHCTDVGELMGYMIDMDKMELQ